MTELAAQLGPWVAIVALLLGIVNTVGQWLGRPGKALEAKIKAVEDAAQCADDKNLDAFKAHDRRIQKLEDGAPHQPTKEDLHSLSLQIAKLGEKLAGLSHTVDRMDRHLMDQSK